MGVKEIVGIIVILLAVVGYFVMNMLIKKEEQARGDYDDDSYDDSYDDDEYDDDEYDDDDYDDDDYDDDDYEEVVKKPLPSKNTKKERFVDDDDEFDDIVVEEENKEKNTKILSLDESFKSLIKPVWLEKKLLSMDKFYSVRLQVGDEILEENFINTTFVVEVLGRFLYGGEARIEKISETEIATPSFYPFSNEPERFVADNVKYIPPCTKINKEIYTNSLFTTYLKTTKLIAKLQLELRDGLNIIDLLPNNHHVLDKKAKKKQQALSRVELMAISQLLETVFLTTDERVGIVSTELFENIYELYDVDFDEDLKLVIETTEMDKVGNSQKVISYSIDRWYASYVREVQTSKALRDGFYVVTDIIQNKSRNKTTDEIEKVENLLGEGILNSSTKDVNRILGEKACQSFVLLPHFRERMCFVSQFPQLAKDIKVLDILPRISGV